MRPLARAVVLAVLSASLAAQASWTRLYPASAPARRSGESMAFDAVRGQVILFGGQQADAPYQYLDDLWAWTGTQWTQVTTPVAPPPRQNYGFVSDTSRGRVVMFGGVINPGDTWEWNGTQWQQRTPVHRPSARSSFGMTFDANRARCVLFGGEEMAGGSFSNETWEWDGTDWLQRQPATSPVARRQPQLVFDGARGVSVLFGGQLAPAGANQYANDTWTWNGTNWQLQFPAHMPEISYGHRLVYDSARARVVGHGFGYYIGSFSWEWDGQDWHIVLQASPGPFAYVPMAYDPIRRQVVYYGSQWQAYSGSVDTWGYGTASPATSVAYGSGCPGSAGVPVLANAPYSLPWLGDTFRTRADNLAASTVAVFFATGLLATPPQDLTPYGMPGCSSWLTIDAVDFAPTASGTATWSIAIPNTTALNGVQLHQQAFAVEPGANAAGVITTNAIDFAIGIR